MERIIGIMIGGVIIIVIILASTYIFVFEGEDDGGASINFNGMYYTWEELETEFGLKTVEGNSGISLSAILNSTDFSDLPSNDRNNTLFRITADDGWQKNVTWTDLQTGILIEEERMTYFPDLPGAYKVRDLSEIATADLGPLAVIKANASWDSSAELTWSRIFNELTPVSFTAGGQNYNGVPLTALLEFAGFNDIENASFTIEGVDNYAKTVNWTSIQNGYLVQEDFKTVFPDLPGSYRVKYIVRITVD